MKAQDLKQLAVFIADQPSIDNKVIDYIMNRLEISDLKLFKRYLDVEISKKKLFVEVTDDSKNLTSELQRLFPDREIEISENKSLGGGLNIIDQDNHYDLSVRNRIDQIIENLKN